MKKIIFSTILISVLVWIISIFVDPPLDRNLLVWEDADYDYKGVWIWGREMILLTGITAYAFMSFIMLLVIRPKWLEKYFDGLDKMYAIHKWVGILAVGIGGIHYLLDFTAPHLLGAFYIKPEKISTSLQDIAGAIGEYAYWMIILLVVVSLWKKVSYHIWKYSHKLTAVFYLAIVFHAIVLSPASYWLQPIGVFIALCSSVGTISALISIFGLIGRSSQFKGKISRIHLIGQDLIEITCEIEGNWEHKAGQYVFLKIGENNESHPFTIASADKRNNELRIYIKVLGDDTLKIQKEAKVGKRILIEGPYGRFDFKNSKSNSQIWVAGGVGITPFIAWLEALQNDPNKEKYKIDLYYSIRNQEEAAFIPTLEGLCNSLPNIHLHVQYTDEMGFLTADALKVNTDKNMNFPDVWFCGPTGFSEALKTDLTKIQYPLKQFHQEIFQMR